MIFIYPTDTAYALGCDARDSEAISKIFEIKNRQESKTLPLIASNIEMVREWCELSGKAESLAEKNWPGPLTLVLQVKKQGLSESVINNKCVAIRVPDSESAQTLSAKFDAPIVSTSANKSGGKNLYSIDEVKKTLASKINLVDKIIDNGELEPKDSSTILKIENNKIKILREGAMTQKIVIARSELYSANDEAI